MHYYIAIFIYYIKNQKYFSKIYCTFQVFFLYLPFIYKWDKT